MSEQFEGGINQKKFSEAEVRKIQDLVSKVRELIVWDLGKICSTNEEIEMVNKANDAMKDLATMFALPKVRFWAEPETEEHKPKPIEPKTLSADDLNKLRSNLKAISEVVSWDISVHDEKEIAIVSEAREAIEALKKLL